VTSKTPLFKNFGAAAHTPKFERILQAIREAVASKRLRVGERLPSLQQVSRELGVSVNTVVKAYERLRREGVIRSSFAKGFYVRTESVDPRIHVFLLFDELNPFKEALYNAFTETLGRRATVDVFFHHYRREVFESLLQSARGRYTVYVVMPPPDRRAHAALDAFDLDDVLILDQRHGVSSRFPFVAQDFENDTFDALSSGAGLIRRYDRFLLRVPDPGTSHHLGPFAAEIGRGFARFCREARVPHRLVRDLAPARLQRGDLHLVIAEEDLVALVKAVQARGLRVGADVGVISYNESPWKEIVAGGIATISTDFTRMGRTAAELVLTRPKPAAVVNPSALIVRRSIRREETP
jgi:DNA-binding transcriptional regulator YhcF (GntR family)